MQTIKDAQMITGNQQLFIGRPLQMLLKEIVPEIKMVSVRESWAEAIGTFVFRFLDPEEERAYNLTGKTQPVLIVKVKEALTWNKPLAERWKWTKEDAEKYGTLTVVYIGVLSENHLTTGICPTGRKQDNYLTSITRSLPGLN